MTITRKHARVTRHIRLLTVVQLGGLSEYLNININTSSARSTISSFAL